MQESLANTERYGRAGAWPVSRLLVLGLLLILCAAFAKTGYGQYADGGPSNYTGAQRDSLRRIGASAKNLNDRAEALAELGLYFYLNNIDSSLYYYRKARAIAIQNGKGSAHFFASTGLFTIYRDKGQYDSIFHYLNASLSWARSHGDSLEVAKVLCNRSIVYRRLLDYRGATEDNLKAIHLLRVHAPTEHFHEAIFLNNLGRIRSERGELQQSEEAYRQVIALAAQFPDQIPRVQLGMALYFLVGVLAKAGDIERTEAALEAYKTFSSRTATDIRHGEITSMLGDTTMAIQYFTAALKHHLATRQAKKAARDASNLAQLAAARGRYASAIGYGRLALQEANADLETIDFTLPILYNSYERLGRPDSAYFYLARHKTLLDSTGVIEQQKQISRLEVEYATLEAKTALALQKADLVKLSSQRSSLAILLLAGLIMLGAVLLFFWQRLRLKETINQQQAQLLEAERRGHERDQKVIAIRNMVLGQETERKRIAQDLHDGLSGTLMSAKAHLAASTGGESEASPTQRRSLTLLDEAYEEVRRISYALMPQSIHLLNISGAITDLADGLLAHGITPQVVLVDEVDATLQTDIKLTIYRILQELTANTIKHANATEVLISVAGRIRPSHAALRG